MTLQSIRPRTVIVEDQDDLREAFVEYLKNLGYPVDGLCCGEELDEYLSIHQPSILILDIGLPGENGFEIAERIRKSHPGLYIVMLTVLNSEHHKIRGYATADLYLPKPVTPGELTAALQAASRRIDLSLAASKGLVLDLMHSRIIGNGKHANLNLQEKALLKALAEARDGKVPTWRLIEIVSYTLGTDIEKPYLELQIFRLRKKLQEVGVPSSVIKARWKEGYQLLYPVVINGY